VNRTTLEDSSRGARSLTSALQIFLDNLHVLHETTNGVQHAHHSLPGDPNMTENKKEEE
jgi:hypothetical protein